MHLPFRARKKDRRPLFTDADKDNIRWFWDNYLKEKGPWLALVFGMIIAQGFVYQQFLSLTESGLRVIFESGTVDELITVCATVFGVFVFRGFMSYLIPRMSAWIASDAIKKLRNQLINHLILLDLSYFERTAPADVILRLVQQADALSMFVGQSTVKALRDGATVIILSVYLCYKQPLLFMTAAAVLPFIILTMQIVSNRIKGIQQSAENALGAYIGGIEEMVNGMRTVKIAGQEEFERHRLHNATDLIKDLSIRLQAAQALVLPYIDVAAAFVYTLVIGGGGYMVLSPDFDIDGAGIITFLLGLVLIFDPGRRVAQFFINLQASLIILAGVRSTYDVQPTIVDREGATTDFDPLGDLVFDDVSFAYSEDQPLFSGLDLTFKGGEVTAIVGPTGSGKTTILSLLARLYDVTGGAVRFGDHDVRDLNVKALRSAFSVVAQDIVIFNNSIWENIKYVRPEASDEEIWAAAEAAEIADLIRARSGASVGPKGAQLSGGQKQRIAIARAFLRAAPVVLLDEATSALDQKTEEKVKVALSRLAKNKTTIVVAHRLSSVIDADQIYVLEAGSVAENGSHDELIKAAGLYASLYNAQRKGYRD